MKVTSETGPYRRGQVVGALWRTLAHGVATEAPKAFLRRVSKLTELGVPFSGRERPGQGGIDNDYFAPQAFELGVALVLLDSGLKQTEVAFFVQHVRSKLREAFERIMLSPPVPRNVVSASDRPNSPKRDLEVADTSCFMTFRLVELREAQPTRLRASAPYSYWQGTGDPPLIFGPEFHFGRAELAKEVERLDEDLNDRIRTVVELSTLAVLIDKYLREAPIVRRGNPGRRRDS